MSSKLDLRDYAIAELVVVDTGEPLYGRFGGDKRLRAAAGVGHVFCLWNKRLETYITCHMSQLPLPI